jgi:hypothetical protein
VRKKVKIRERKLGRHNAHGIVHEFDSDNPLIELDTNLKGKDRLIILTHELLHCCFPAMQEKRVIAYAKLIGGAIWAENYRRIDQ